MVRIMFVFEENKHGGCLLTETGLLFFCLERDNNMRAGVGAWSLFYSLF
jgi:hypothetical protein